MGHAPESGKPSSRASMHSNTQRRRQSHAHWWFARMRQVVDDALERQPDPPPMP
jgi:hypothetical protein